MAYAFIIQAKRELSRQAVERGINQAAYWVEQQQQQLEGTKEVYSASKYEELSNSKGAQNNEIESQFVNLAFEADEKNDIKMAKTMQQLELEFLKRHYNE